MSKELDQSRRAYLKALAVEKNYTTADRLVDLIPLGIDDLDTFSNRELREVIGEIIRDDKAKNMTNLIGAVGLPSQQGDQTK
jgi:hypothetical protein